MRYQDKNRIYRLLVRILLLILSILYILSDLIQVRGLSLYSTVLCAILMFLAYQEKKRLISEYTIVLAFVILFHFGQSIIYICEPTRYLPVYDNFANVYVIEAIQYSMICLQVFDITFTFYQPIIEINIKYRERSPQCYLSAAELVSKIALIILTPVIIFNLLLKTIFSLKYGYMNLYAYDGAGYRESAIMPYLQNLFVIMCVLRIVSCSFDKKKSRISLLLMVMYSLLMFLIGSRSGMLSVLLTAILIYDTKIREGRKESKGKIFLLAIALIAGSVFMSYFRLVTDKTGVGFTESLNYVLNYNPLSTMMIEMGGSLKPVIYCVEIFSGAESFRGGISYLASFFLLIPNVGKILGQVHPASGLTNLSQWLMDYMHLDHGPGFSIIAESYYNFGKIGWIVFVIWAIVFCNILGNPKLQNEERNFISYATMILLFPLIRGSVSDFIRFFIFEVILVDVFVKIIAYGIRKR